MAKEIEIPEGYVARIEGNKVIIELAESEDERIRKAIRLILIATEDDQRDFYSTHNITRKECTAWLERQKENIEKEYVFRPLAGADITIAAEQAIRRAKDGEHLVLAFNGMYTPVSKYDSTKGLVDKYNTYLEEQKDASKAIEAVERIDKYIDAHTANAHDMDDSNPDKKYYQGQDDALGKIAGILQYVYSDEKQKEHQPNIELIQRSWYLEGYHDREFGKEPKWIIKTGEGGPEYEENPKYGQMLKEQKSAEWSEEDKLAIDRACVALRAYSNGDLPEFLPSELLGYADRLQSLLSPQPHWKPSEGQMKALLNAEGLVRASNYSKNAKILAELYEQLKRL